MRLLQVTTLFLLLTDNLCSSDDNPDAPPSTTSVTSLTAVSTSKESTSAQNTTSAPNLAINPTTESPPHGTTDKKLLKTPVMPAVTSLTTIKSEQITTPPHVTNNEVSTMQATMTDVPKAVSTLPSSQHKTEDQNSINTTEMSVNAQPSITSPKTTTSPSMPITTLKNISEFQDTENGKNATTASTNPSYSSIILPVVIALIVITLLVFTLVGLYRMCLKKDPGTPENGNDQPQTDKESVKLLTVKTISHESGEHSAQGKSKN